MKTIQMTLNENLLNRIDMEVKMRHKSRSAFIRESILHYLKNTEISALEKQHIKGYKKHPVKKGEFDVFEDEQVWGS